MSDATLDGNLDEARFRASLLREKSELAQLTHVTAMVVRVQTLLGPPGSYPNQGYGRAMLDLADVTSACLPTVPVERSGT